MLTRIISGAVGVVLLSAVLFFHDTIVLPIAVAAMIAVMLFELLRAVRLEKCLPILIPVELCGIAVPLVCCFSFYRDQQAMFTTTDYYSSPFYLSVPEARVEIFGWEARLDELIFAVTLAAAFVIFLTWLARHKTIRYEQVFFALACMILVPQAMTTMIRIDRFSSEHGLFLLIMGLCGAWIADTGAYFTGVAFGRHKLCPEISPKKTVEGFIGGLVLTGIVYAAAFGVYSHYNNGFAQFGVIGYVGLFILGVLCAVVGAIGDLSASMVKRQIGFKDYGRIMPGHGGLMDRFDSVLFVLPTYYAFIALTGIF